MANKKVKVVSGQLKISARRTAMVTSSLSRSQRRGVLTLSS